MLGDFALSWHVEGEMVISRSMCSMATCSAWKERRAIILSLVLLALCVRLLCSLFGGLEFVGIAAQPA